MSDFKNFSEPAIKTVMLAQEESRRSGHNFVGREQLLVGLLDTDNGAARLLKAAGVTLEAARAEVEEIIGRGSGFVAVEMPFTPLLSNWVESLIFRRLKRRKLVDFSQSDKRGLLQMQNAL